MAKNVLLDTDVIIHLLRKDVTTIKILSSLQQQNSEFYLCPVVVAEIYAGAFTREYADIEQFFSYCHTLTIDSEIGKLAGIYANQLRKSYNKISMEDFLIAACAKKFQLYLWTYNAKHYPMQDIQLIKEHDV